ncbi:MAG: DUF1501 domain-containing protein [Verrucomicrobiales bacterium]
MNEILRKSDAWTRREMMSFAAKTFLGVGLVPGVTAAEAFVGSPSRRPTARNVIYLYMSGGMTHLDTFDPKPEAGPEYMGDLKAISTKADGVQISEYFPGLASQMDKVAVIRSLQTTQGAHEQGNYYMHTSYTPRGTIKHPGLGSWILRHEGRTNRTLPGAVCIGGGSRGSGSGWMESKFAPVFLGNPNEGLRNSVRHSETSEREFNDRLALANAFDEEFHGRYDQKKVRAFNDMYADALRLMRSEDLNAFDIGGEPGNIKEMYGANSFGQGCLLARRLVEHDVRFVEVTLGGWDTHNNNFAAVEARAAVLDQALTGLLKDLDQRGMLDETMVVLATEFGRTPKVNQNDGRDHFPKAFCGLIAGGGIKGGQAYGASDEYGMDVAENRVLIPDFNATIAYGLGLPYQNIIHSPSGRPFKVANNGQPIKELFG